MKTKKFFLIALLLFSCLLFNAQEKYQFLIIEYSWPGGKLSVSIDGTEFKKDKVDLSGQDNTGYNANPLLLKVKEYQDKDWELINFNTMINTSGNEIYFAYMRKKKAK